MCISLAACGGDDAKTSAGSQKLPQLTGVTAKGTPGKKPEISFKTPTFLPSAFSRSFDCETGVATSK